MSQKQQAFVLLHDAANDRNVHGGPKRRLVVLEWRSPKRTDFNRFWLSKFCVKFSHDKVLHLFTSSLKCSCCMLKINKMLFSVINGIHQLQLQARKFLAHMKPVYFSLTRSCLLRLSQELTKLSAMHCICSQTAQNIYAGSAMICWDTG